MRSLPRAFLLASVLSAVAQCGGSVAPRPRPSPDGECDYNAPFGSAEVVLGLREIGTENPWGAPHGATLSVDELEIYFDKINRDPGVAYTASLYTARRSQRGAEWSRPERLSRVPLDWWAWNPQLSPDGLTLYFTKWPDNAGPNDYYLLRRASKDAPFSSAPVVLPLLPAGSRPFFSADGRSVYYTLPVAKDNTTAIVRREWDGTKWTGEPQELIHDGSRPIVSADELHLYYATNGEFRYATRSSTSEPFAEIGTLPEVTESPVWLSPNACRVYLAPAVQVLVAQRGR